MDWFCWENLPWFLPSNISVSSINCPINSITYALWGFISSVTSFVERLHGASNFQTLLANNIPMALAESDYAAPSGPTGMSSHDHRNSEVVGW